MEFDLEDPLSAFCAATVFFDEEDDNRVAPKPSRSRRRRPASIQALFAAEAEQHVSTARLDDQLRHDAVSLVLHAREDSDLDPHVAYLAVNYVDRFLSQRELPSDKPWIVRLLAIACLSLAAKMNKLDVSVADFQRDERFIHDSRTIRRMELLVLGALGWRMRSVTPFSFLEFFLAYFPSDDGIHQAAALKERASQIVFQSQTDTKLLEYKPSEIAASALIVAADEMFPAVSPSFRAAVSACHFVNNATLWCCLQSMGGSASSAIDDDCVAGALYAQDYPAAAFSSSCDTPVTVLGHHHRHCPSSESERTLSTAAAAEQGTKKARISSFIRRSTAAGCRRGRD